VAQLVEHSLGKGEVAGSSPATCTIIIQLLRCISRFGFLSTNPDSNPKDTEKIQGQAVFSLLNNDFDLWAIDYSFLRPHRDREKGNNDN
jgi:hypothetical protein